MRALIIDDDEPSCQLLAKILARAGLEAEWTTDSLAGYELACQQPYDLFILDVHMPLLPGADLAEGLKKDQPTAKILLISAFADEHLGQTAKRLGVSLLSKPFSPDQLLAVLTALVG